MNSLSIIAILCLFACIPFACSKSFDSNEEFSWDEIPMERAAESVEEENDQIVGGGIVSAKLYSYMAAIVDRTTMRLICTGTLYKARYILTAGHCVYGKSLTQIGVLLNTTRILNLEPGFVALLPQKITIAPNFVYTNTMIQNDFAIIDMGSTRVPLLSRLQSVRFAQVFPEPSYAGVVGLTLGWGATATGSATSNDLKMASVRITDNATCQRMMIDFYMNSGAMCATNTAMGSACYGDDGGPIFYGGVQVGVTVKSPYPCGQTAVPTIYMRIGGSSYPWIVANTP